MFPDENKNVDDPAKETVTVFFEDNAQQVPAGISAAAAVLGYFKTNHTCTNPSTGEKRGPHCLMGVCFDCMVEINGVPNQQGCMVPVEEGMRIRRQEALFGGE